MYPNLYSLHINHSATFLFTFKFISFQLLRFLTTLLNGIKFAPVKHCG